MSRAALEVAEVSRQYMVLAVALTFRASPLFDWFRLLLPFMASRNAYTLPEVVLHGSVSVFAILVR